MLFPLKKIVEKELANANSISVIGSCRHRFTFV